MKVTKKNLDTYLNIHTPTIACVNHASDLSRADFDALVAALQVFVDDHVAPAWGTPANLVKKAEVPKGCWGLVFLNHRKHGLGLAYHDLTHDGYPQSKVFVQTVRADGKQVSVAASHELVEMLVDPSMNLEVMKPDGKLVHRYEAADPVQDLEFKIDGIAMTNFVYPAYFESFHKPGSVQFDHMKKLKKPFELHKHGYQSVRVNGKWIMRFGSLAQQKLFEKQDRRNRRLHRRATVKRRLSAKSHPRRAKAKA